MDSRFGREVVVGSIVLAAALVFGAGVLWLNGKSINPGDDKIIVQLPDAGQLKAGARISVDPIAGIVTDHDGGATLACEPLPQHLLAMVRDGGLMPHLQKKFAAQRGGEARP